jgi:DNA-binding beta-propeller fold protein YncE
MRKLLLIILMLSPSLVFAQNLSGSSCIVYNEDDSKYYISNLRKAIYATEDGQNIETVINTDLTADVQDLLVKGDNIYVADGNKFKIFSISSKSLVDEIELSTETKLHGMTYLEGVFWVTDTENSRIYKIDENDNYSVSQLNMKSFTEPIGIQANNGYVYFVTRKNDVIRIDPETDNLLLEKRLINYLKIEDIEFDKVGSIYLLAEQPEFTLA